MGLAFPSLSSYPATPYFNTLISQGVVSAGQFGFKLASSGSSLFLGGADSSLYTGAINWNPVTKQVCPPYLIRLWLGDSLERFWYMTTRVTGKLHLMPFLSNPVSL